MMGVEEQICIDPPMSSSAAKWIFVVVYSVNNKYKYFVTSYHEGQTLNMNPHL